MSHDERKPELSLPLKQYLESEPSRDLEEAVWARLCARRDAAREPAQAQVTLPLPLNTVLLDGDELAPERARLWRGVRARIHRPRRQRRMPRKAAMLLAAALGAAAAFALAVLTWQPPEPLAVREQTHAGGDKAGPLGALVAADGRPLGLLDATREAETVRLSDASEIRLDRGARLEPVLSTSSRFELLLARGTAEFSVTPGGPRRWSIDAGAARIEVVGTVFRVARLAGRVEVAVSRGAVLVIGEGVPGRVRRLTAGQQLAVVSATPVPGAAAGSVDHGAAATGPLPTSTAPAEALSTSRAPSDAQRQTHASSQRRHAARPVESQDSMQSPHERYAQLGPAGLARETMKATSIEQLLELADVARLSGHPQDAVAPLTRALDAFRGSRQAALAAFTLGRVLLDQLNVAKPAAEAFERAIVLGLPKALRADCYRRLAEAYGRAGNESERARAEARFQTEFALPSGTLDKVAP
jgi:transmembrane sensor